MAPKGIKASNLFGRRSKVKVIEYVARERARGTRYVPVEIKTSKNRQSAARDTVKMEVDGNQEVSQEASLPSTYMDVDETFWLEEPDTCEQRRVS
jgi:hypothetical protein